MGESILDGLRARRRAEHARIQNRHLDLELPSYGGELVVRYRPPEEFGDAQEKMRLFLSASGDEQVYTGCDLLIFCCDMVLLADADGKLTPLHEAVTEDSSGGDIDGFDLPVKLDSRLARAVEVDVPAPEEDGPGPARLTLMTIIGDDYALSGHAAKVALWLTELVEAGTRDF